MPSVREEITKTLLRLSRRVQSRHGLAQMSATNLKPPPAIRDSADFGTYRILHKIGSGGMGHVYLATDTRLGRKVALKFLSPTLVAEPEMLRRLQAEARTASALNHPNILTIYEIGERDGQPFIASEFVEGQTLRTALNKKAVNVQTGIDIGCQVLSALAAAHQAGIIHRDLKPGNVMIRPDGYVKVIDFGLAKRTREFATDESGLEQSMTRPGTVVGTVFYMSPEQACGGQIDHRTDIWSLGIILFELLAHRRPFEGDSDNRVIVNICSKPLPPIENSEALPPGLQPVIEKALQKDPADRYTNAREMLDDLSAVGLVPPSRTIRTAFVSSKPKQRWMLPVVGVAVVLLALAGWFVYRYVNRGPDWFQIARVRQLTFNGHVISAAISPDGKYLAYVAGDPDGLQTVFLMQVNGASETVKIPPRNTQYLGLTFAPDDQLFLVAENRDDLIGRLYEVPVVGTVQQLRPLITDIDGPVAFSPSGDQMAFVRNIPSSGPRHDRKLAQIFVVSRTDPTPKNPLFSTTEFAVSRYLSWSPVGDRLAAIFFRYADTGSSPAFLEIIDMKGAETRRDLPAWQLVGRTFWDFNGASIFTTAADHREAAIHPQVRQIDVKRNAIQNLTREIAGYQGLSATADRSLLAITKIESKASLWISAKSNFLDGRESWAEAEWKPTLSWANDTELIVGSMRGGYPNLWRFDSSDQTRSELTHEDFAEQEAVAVPASESVIFVSQRSRESKIWRFDPGDNRYRQLTFGPNADASPTVTPDGKWVYYWSISSSTPFIFRVPATGGPTMQVTNFPAEWPQISPDGKSVLCWMQDARSSRWGVGVFPVNDPSAARIIPDVSLPVVWSPRSSALTAAITDQRNVSNLWDISLDGRRRRRLTAFNDKVISKFAWSPDHKQLACLRSQSASDVILFSRNSVR